MYSENSTINIELSTKQDHSETVDVTNVKVKSEENIRSAPNDFK